MGFVCIVWVCGWSGCVCVVLYCIVLYCVVCVRVYVTSELIRKRFRPGQASPGCRKPRQFQNTVGSEHVGFLTGKRISWENQATKEHRRRVEPNIHISRAEPPLSRFSHWSVHFAAWLTNSGGGEVMGAQVEGREGLPL